MHLYFEMYSLYMESNKYHLLFEFADDVELIIIHNLSGIKYKFFVIFWLKIVEFENKHLI